MHRCNFRFLFHGQFLTVEISVPFLRTAASIYERPDCIADLPICIFAPLQRFHVYYYSPVGINNDLCAALSRDPDGIHCVSLWNQYIHDLCIISVSTCCFHKAYRPQLPEELFLFLPQLPEISFQWGTLRRKHRLVRYGCCLCPLDLHLYVRYLLLRLYLFLYYLKFVSGQCFRQYLIDFIRDGQHHGQLRASHTAVTLF